ncbi:uncharacterized protein LOC110466076 isoform X2 [Mizuhopecten yessoensis]|uniref:uncharacterized protein LOC110466076 isoform X2 n=1 Tax=Mizuhopecten yessoensis TaxID=6573 RepID=UPI000B458D88|nr:uncharacterized protein LOC110466076 isoform X2 [Mizuhopecten yessoensis]
MGTVWYNGRPYLELLPENTPLTGPCLNTLTQESMEPPEPQDPLLGTPGVADLDDIHVSPDHRQTANGKQRPSSTAKNYDYADYGGHQYEELPHPKAAAGRQTSPESCSEYQSSAGTVTAETPSESGDTAAIVRNSDQRKRYNPLYDTMVGSSPNIYNKVKAAQPNNVVQERLRMLKIIVIFLILISCLSLAISLYIVIVYAAGPLTIQSLQKELNSLHNNYSDLNQKLHFLETMMTGNMSLEYLEELGQRVSELKTDTSTKILSLEQNLQETKELLQHNQKIIDNVYGNASLQINATQHQLLAFQSNFTSHLTIIQSDFEDKLSIISKMPGPQGPPGVGNLSACYMRDFDSSSSSQTIQTDTQWEPDNNVLKANVVMFVMCGVRNGVDRYLEVRESSAGANKFQYRCLCSGKTSTSTTRTCITHFWLCPRESFGGS